MMQKKYFEQIKDDRCAHTTTFLINNEREKHKYFAKLSKRIIFD
jgi:hypothetical protein